jgi:ribosomal protein S18 acetylase RimI-like enzyme
VSAAPCRLVEWDTEFWGVGVAQVVGATLTDARRSEVDGWCRDHDVACAYFLAEVDDPESTLAAERGGFFFTDVRATLAQSLDGRARSPVAPSIRTARADDREALAAIARESHRITRFYHDPNFPDRRCDELYAQWILSSCEDPASDVLVADIGGGAAGYVTCALDADRGRIGLIAVASGHRRGGIGGALVEAALRRFADSGVSEAVVVTQGRNTAALRVFTRAGYSIERMQLWFHKWYR